MIQKVGKVLRTLAICIGCLFFLSAFLSKDVSIWMRIRDIILGILIIAFATISIVRQLGLSFLAFILGISCVISMFNEGYVLTFPDFMLPPVFLGISIYYFCKVRKQVKECKKIFNCFNAREPFDSFNSTVITTEEGLKSFLLSHTLLDEFHTKVVGVTFRNKDGTSRQDILSQCHIGDEIALRFYKYKRSPAYAVHCKYGQIGNLSADLAKTIDIEYDGCTIQATISSITGGYGGLFYGCNIFMRFFQEKSLEIEFTDSYKPSGNCEPQAQPIESQENIGEAKIISPEVTDHESTVDYSFIAEAQWYAARHDDEYDAADTYT